MAMTLCSSAMCNASKAARSPFLKSEAFRILSIMLARAIQFSSDDSQETDDGRGVEALRTSCRSLVNSLVEAMQDSEMKKTKRIRDVLKTAEKLVAFLEKSEKVHSDTLTSFITLKEQIDLNQEESASQGVSSLCESVSGKLEVFITEFKAKTESATSTNAQSSGGKKKKKKKKGKKK